jgi:lysophospholipase L1-like esterase
MMRARWWTMLVLALGLALPAAAQTAPAGIGERPPVTRIKPSKIILVGDSTVQQMSGWGGAFCAKHVTSFLACVNLGRGGRSTYNYRAEGSWDIALGEMKAPGYEQVWVLIQFGHNDQPGKPGRSTDLATEFPENLRGYIRDVRAAGAIPVLVTPLTRRSFKDGQLQRDLDPWGDAIRAVGKEMEVPVVDLLARSEDAVQGMGPSLANRLGQAIPSREVAASALTGTTIGNPPAPAAAPPVAGAPAAPIAAVEPMGDPKLSFDYTHLGSDGADFFSAMVAAELAVKVPKLRRFLLP